MLINILASKSNEKEKLNNDKCKEKFHLFCSTPSRKNKRNFLKSNNIIAATSKNTIDIIKSAMKLMSNY